MAKSIVGTVSSISGDKTIVITTVWRKTHPIYKKQYSISTKYMAHDPKNECRVGDKVVIEESRPLSARKRYALKEIIERAALSKDDLSILKSDEPAKKNEEPAEEESK